ncbi:MAG: VTT domain-containing protein [Terracidiphilus sp.]
MSFFASSTAKIAAPRAHHTVIPSWLIHLGPLGLFAVSIFDSSIIPLPIPGTTDLLLLWLVSHNGNAWLLAPCAIVGSLVGGYTTWRLGLKGGEAALKRWVSARMHARIIAWVGSHPILAVFLPALLPPPIPLSPFILASGALGVSRRRFLAAYSAARVLRYSFISWLAVSYGRHVVRLWSNELDKWSAPLLWTFLVLLVGGVGFSIWQFRRKREAHHALEPETVHAK